MQSIASNAAMNTNTPNVRIAAPIYAFILAQITSATLLASLS